MKVVIVDDEPGAVEVITSMMQSYYGDQMSELNSFNSPEEAMIHINNQPPDLLFLDIDMPEMSGFELLSKLDQKNFKLIFITAYDQYAIEAFRSDALDYILKPIDPDLFCDAVNKAIDQIKQSSFSSVDRLLQQLNRRQKVGLPTKDGYHLFDEDEIIFVEAEGSYSKIALTNTHEHVISKNLKTTESLLDNSRFLRVNRSTLVNLNHIVKFTKSEGGAVTMRNNKEFFIGKKDRMQIINQIQMEFKPL